MKKKQYSTSVALKINYSNIEKPANDYSFWDDMITFINKPDTAWARMNVYTLIDVAKIDYVWIYNNHFDNVYLANEDSKITIENAIPKEAFLQLFDTVANGKKRFAHFFLKQDSQIVEIVGATVHSTIDKDRVQHSSGFIFIGKALDQENLSELSTLTNSDVKIFADTTSQKTLKNKYFIVIDESLTNWKNEKLATLKFMSNDQFAEDENKYNLFSILGYLIIVVLVIIATSFFVHYKISSPLYKITKTLKTEDEIHILKTENRKDEFGKIAGLIHVFFKQKVELQEKNEKLLQLNEEVKQQNEEMMVQNEMLLQQKEEIQTQTEQLLEINQELEKLSIVASKTDNSVVITTANGDIEWVNDGFEKMLGVTFHQFKEEYGGNLLETSLNQNIKEIIKECSEKKQSSLYTCKTTTKSGREIWIQTTLTPIFDEEDKIIRFVAIDTDVTSIKNAEQKIALQSKNIRGSIQYARRIQSVVLSTGPFLTELFSEHFLFLKPKDIVSGDFYWMREKGNLVYFAAVDCTGHGVPGAFMSILSISFLNDIIENTASILNANDFLNNLREHVIKALHQGDSDPESKDGMDIALCIYDKSNQTLQFAGANNSMFLVRKGEPDEYLKENSTKVISANEYTLYDIVTNKMPIGIYKDTNPFKKTDIALQKDDQLYLFSDGYFDQFGGKNARKFLKANFRTFLLTICDKKMDVQKMLLDKNLRTWRGREKQIDDIMIVGIKI